MKPTTIESPIPTDTQIMAELVAVVQDPALARALVCIAAAQGQQGVGS